jgi:hypothetical protein
MSEDGLHPCFSSDVQKTLRPSSKVERARSRTYKKRWVEKINAYCKTFFKKYQSMHIESTKPLLSKQFETSLE